MSPARALDTPAGRHLNAPLLAAAFAGAGAVAQMGERCNRTAEVRGSIPLGSTSHSTGFRVSTSLGRIAEYSKA